MQQRKPITNAMQLDPSSDYAAGRLTRLADLAYRRRGRMVLAWIAVFAAAVVLAPRLAGEFSTEFATSGSESEAAADLIGERFPGTSGDTIVVVWQAPAGARDAAVLDRVERFLAQAERLDGIAGAQPARVSRDGTIALTRLDPSFVSMVVRTLEHAVTRPATPSYPRVSAQLQAMLEAVLTGRLGPERSAQRTAEMIEAITGLPVLREADASAVSS